jgi:hypothetical protein
MPSRFVPPLDSAGLRARGSPAVTPTVFTLIDDGTAHVVDAHSDGSRVCLAPEVVRRTLGWELKPEGLCKDDVCVPVRDRAALAGADGIDLAVLAAALGRPLALDAGERAAHLGVAAAARTARLTSLAAPDFTLPDLDGVPHRLSDYRGRKVLLVAYASW